MKINEGNYVDEAEKVILFLKEKKNLQGKTIQMVTTSKLRNLLAMAADIYNEVLNCQKEELNDEICSRIEYLRVRFLYEAGKEPKVRDLVERAGILDILREIHASKSNYLLFHHYMEALVAFHRYHGGKEQ